MSLNHLAVLKKKHEIRVLVAELHVLFQHGGQRTVPGAF